ncbi:MAG: hypothetical protein ACSHX9_09915 [Luteolibacter sp.]
MQKKSFASRFTKGLSLLLFFTLIPPAMSQDEGAPATKGDNLALPGIIEGDTLCRVVCTFQTKPGETYYLKLKDKYQEIFLAGESLSQAIPVRGARKFSLYRKAEDEEESETGYMPILEQALEGVGSNYLLILGRSKEGVIQSKAINLNSSIYPADHIYVINHTSATLGAQINTTQAVIDPFKEIRYGYRDAGRDTYTSAKIVMQYEGETKIMASKRLRLVPGRRMILICFPSEERVAMDATPLRMVLMQDKP